MTITDSARRLALVAVVAMLAALFPLSGALAQDPGDAIVLDLDGENAVEYALRWSQVVYDADTLEGDTAPDTALIGRDDIFADSLASGVLQGASDSGSPLLLTPSDALAEETAAELERLGVENVTILGLEAAISEDVEAELEDLGYTVDRQGGQTRIETAIDIAEDIDSDTAILARAFGTDEETQAFADSLAAGGWAAGSDYPVLLTQTEVLTGNTATHLEEAGYTEVIIVGGEAAVSAEVEASVAELADTVTRVGGGTRFETAVLIAEARGFESPADAEGVILVDGQVDDAWADGFPAANLSGMGWPIVLSNSAADGLPEPTVTWLEGDAAFASEHLTDVVGICGSTVPDDAEGTGGDQCGEFAEILDATVVDFVPPGTDPEPVENAGVVTFCDTAGDSVDFTSEAGEAVTVAYDTVNDTFMVDGTEATSGAFEVACTPGDQIEVTEDADGNLTLSLTNVAEEDITEGTVGNVETGTTEFDIIEPVSGVVLRDDAGTGIDYSGSLLLVDGAPATETTFSNDINEGDTIVITEDAVGNLTFDLTNESVSGEVSDYDGVDEFQIGNLGDVAQDANDTHYVFGDVAAPVHTEAYTVDGATATLIEFTAAVSDGDAITYARAGNEESFDLVNQAPDTVAGVATDTSVPGGAADGGSVDVLEDGSATPTTITYSMDARFIVDGVLGTEADFEGDLTPGDDVTYTPEDDETGQLEIVTLTNQNLSGTPDNVAGTTYDVENSAGGTIATEDFGQANDRTFVDGAEVTAGAFTTAITECDTDADADCSIVVVGTALADEHRLDTDSSDDA